MIDDAFASYAERELKYQARKAISSRIRENCPEGDAMVTGVVVMLGTVLAMATFNSILRNQAKGRWR